MLWQFCVKDDIVVVQGQPPESIYFIESGTGKMQ